MQILTSTQIHEWDRYTILHEPILSVDLMERAAETCCNWLLNNGYENRSFSIFCGKGNNGGDGLAIARMLAEKKHQVNVYILEFGHKGTEDFQANLARLHETAVLIRFISTTQTIPFIPADDVVVDALLGSGLNRPPDGLTAALISHINQSGNQVIAIDIPSGLSGDQSSKGNTIINARHTLSFQCYKPAFLVAENARHIGALHILDIKLHPDFISSVQQVSFLADHALVRSYFLPRNEFAHKGNFGHVLLIAGSFGKTGAALLCARACLRSGAGLLSVHIPRCGYSIIQSGIPEAMVIADTDEEMNTTLNEDISVYKAVGIGPGIGVSDKTAGLLGALLKANKHPMVIDADALNLISLNKELMGNIPPQSILTPHPKEFDRLFGESANDFDRIALAAQKAHDYQLVIILKGHHTLVATPDGNRYFNTTGNAGMATGGSGDVLTGIITALLAQGYEPAAAAIFGVYIHGMAGDIAASSMSMESLIASDIIDSLGKTFLTFYQQ